MNENTVDLQPSLNSNRKTAYRILLVDDDELIRNLCIVVLKKAGFDVSAKSNGVEALHSLKTSAFDLLLTDYKMPGLTGVELAWKVRRQGLASMPIIIFTNAPDVFDLHDLSFLKLAAILSKDLNNPDFIAAIQKVLSATP